MVQLILDYLFLFCSVEQPQLFREFQCSVTSHKALFPQQRDLNSLKSARVSHLEGSLKWSQLGSSKFSLQTSTAVSRIYKM